MIQECAHTGNTTKLVYNNFIMSSNILCRFFLFIFKRQAHVRLNHIQMSVSPKTTLEKFAARFDAEMEG